MKCSVNGLKNVYEWIQLLTPQNCLSIFVNIFSLDILLIAYDLYPGRMFPVCLGRL